MISLKTKKKKKNKTKKQEIIPEKPEIFFSRYARFYPLNLRFIKESKDQLF